MLERTIGYMDDGEGKEDLNDGSDPPDKTSRLNGFRRLVGWDRSLARHGVTVGRCLPRVERNPPVSFTDPTPS